MPWRDRRAARSVPRSHRPNSHPTARPTHSRAAFPKCSLVNEYYCLASIATHRVCAPQTALLPCEGSSHDLEERSFELIHLLLRADRDAYIGRPTLPHASDVDLFLAH